MRKYLIFLALLGAILRDVSAETDTSPPFPISHGQQLINFTDWSGKPNVITMNGHNNYQAAQQIFYIYGPQQWKMQNGNHLVDKVGKDYLITLGVGAHKLHIRKLSWNKARRTCIQEGGHLAIINSNSEEKILLRLLEEYKVSQAWLGVHDLYEEGDWVTLLDESIETAGYSRWTTKFANEPDNYGGKQHCGVLIKEGGMDDLDCTNTNAFFCEMPI